MATSAAPPGSSPCRKMKLLSSLGDDDETCHPELTTSVVVPPMARTPAGSPRPSPRKAHIFTTKLPVRLQHLVLSFLSAADLARGRVTSRAFSAAMPAVVAVAQHHIGNGSCLPKRAAGEPYLRLLAFSQLLWRCCQRAALPRRVPALGASVRVASVSAGPHHTLFLADTGAVFVSGSGEYLLGDGSPTSVCTSPQLVPLPHPSKAVSAGGSHSVALSSEGTAWVWGRLPGSPQYRLWRPKPARTSVPLVAVDAGWDHVLGVDANGGVVAWGANVCGQLGVGVPAAEAPQRVDGLAGVHVAAVSAGEGFSMALSSEGDVWAWGASTSGQLGVDVASVSTPQHVTALTHEESKEAPGGGSPTNGNKLQRVDRAIAVACGSNHSVVCLMSGRVVTMNVVGITTLAEASTRGLAPKTPPLPSPPPGPVPLDAASPPPPYMWNGTMACKTPAPLVTETHLDSRVVAVSAGRVHTLLVTQSGKAYAAGEGLFGRLGTGSAQSSASPVRVALPAGSHVVDAACASGHSAFLTSSGTLFMSGFGGRGCLGLGSTEDHLLPTPVSLESAAPAAGAGSPWQ